MDNTAGSQPQRGNLRRMLVFGTVAAFLLLVGYGAASVVSFVRAPALGEHVLPAMAAGHWVSSASSVDTATLFLAPEGWVEYKGLSDAWWDFDDPRLQVVDGKPSGKALDPVEVLTGTLKLFDTSGAFDVSVPVRIEARRGSTGTVRTMTIDATGVDTSALGGLPSRWSARD